MSIAAGIMMAVYITGLVMILLYTFMQIHLVYHFNKRMKSAASPASFPCIQPGCDGDGGVYDNANAGFGASAYTDAIANANFSASADPDADADADFKSNETALFPVVTVQLPVYNERYVIERLVKAVTSLDWPVEKLEIQILDDSTDDTIIIIDKVCKYQVTKGIDIKILRRGSRVGFKAGALQYGLEQARGEFIAIFDADFVPAPDFLHQTVPCFNHPDIGMVQTRWGHLNKNYSILTRLQALALDAHFSVEQAGRYQAGFFMNFNGTAGLWRKSCLTDAGGWEHDTITEDLDISYRAQLKGWKFVYLENVVTAAELPVAISALKSQQYRWTKGAAENARKNITGVLKSGLLPVKKMHAVSHLLNSSVFIWIFLISIVSVPLLWMKSSGLIDTLHFNAMSVFFVGLLLWIYFYEVSMRLDESNSAVRWFRMLTFFPLFLALSMGLSFHNSIAVTGGYLGWKSPFIRTPKFNEPGTGTSWKSNVYLAKGLGITTVFEGVLILYFLFGVISAFILNDFGLLAFHLLLLTGYGVLFFRTLYESDVKPIGSRVVKI